MHMEKNANITLKSFKKRFFVATISTPLIFLSIFAIFTYVNVKKERSIICDSSFIIYKDDMQVNLFINYKIFSKGGLVNLSGRVYKSGKFLRNINTKVNFDYIKNGNSYSLHSNNIDVSLFEDSALTSVEGLVPNFYLKNNITWSIEILNQNDTNFLFMSSSTPSFLCINRSS